MSGIFIRDMCLPDNCMECPLSLLNSWGERHCFVTEANVSDCNGWSDNRHSKCPMEEREDMSEQ